MRVTDKAKEALDRLLKSFEEGTVPEAIAKAVLPPLDVPSSAWSLNNRVLMFLAGTVDARGIRQWRKAGRWPMKGSHALYILVPIYTRKQEEDRAQGEEADQQVLVGFRCAPVFAVESTEGKPVEYPALDPPQPPPLAEVAAAWGLALTYMPGNGAWYGYYSPDQGQIGLGTHDPQTFFHELAHAAHHRTVGAIRSGQDFKQEIVAELTAATLMRLYGERPNDGASYRYIQQYAQEAGKDVYRACMSVIADVGRCLDLILKQAEALSITGPVERPKESALSIAV